MTVNAPMDDSDCTTTSSAVAAAGSPGNGASFPEPVVLTTHELESTHARQLWAETLDATYCDLDVDWPETGDFAADLTARHLGDLLISTVRADAHTVVRSPAMVAADPCDDFLLCLVSRGEASVAQGTRSGLLRDGALAILDASRPFVVAAAQQFEQVVIRVPRQQFEARATPTALADVVGRPISADAGIGRLLSTLVADVAAHHGQLSSISGAGVGGALLEMMTAAILEQHAPVTATDRAHADDLSAVQEAMLRQIDDPDCTLANVAAGMGMSLRYVHKLFSASGWTPRSWLYEQRLLRARTLLLHSDSGVCDIGARVGFRDPSHFSRAFRRRYGASPAHYRVALR